MSAELRNAAKEIRATWITPDERESPGGRFHLAVADVLDEMHEWFVREALYEHPNAWTPMEAAAFAAARATLGEDL